MWPQILEILEENIFTYPMEVGVGTTEMIKYYFLFQEKHKYHNRR